eukprot:m.297479 g.297479  ORF g.297479 m.297479 type:complete len:96 (-) comp81555_c0_seq1:79-366(-)
MCLDDYASVLLLLDNRLILALRLGDGGKALALGGNGFRRCEASETVAELVGRVLCRVFGRLRAELDRTGATAAFATAAEATRLVRIVLFKTPVLS